MDVYRNIVGFFQEGGLFMYPIVLVLALGAAIAVERWVYLTRSRSTNRRVWNQLQPLLSKGKYQQAYTICQKSKTAVSNILAYGLGRIKNARRRDDIEKAMEESLMEEMPRLEKRTHYLATFANLATLLGLLGTIIGLISAFTAVAAANPASINNPVRSRIRSGLSEPRSARRSVLAAARTGPRVLPTLPGTGRRRRPAGSPLDY